MTERQHFRYFRLFGLACREYCRRNQIEHLRSADREALRKQWTIAAKLDPAKSHWDYSWSEAQRIFAEFELQAQPDSFDAARRTVQDPHRAALLHRVGQYAADYVGEIVFRVTGGVTRDPDQLRTDQLEKLVITLVEQERRDKRRRIAALGAPHPATGGD